MLMGLQWKPGGREASRVKVVADDRFFDDPSGLAVVGEPYDQWDTDATFVVGTFIGSQRCIARGFVKPSIVRGENDQRLLVVASRPERLHHSPNAAIDALDHGCINRFALSLILGHLLISPRQRLWSLKRGVHSVVGKVKEKWLIFRVVDLRNSFIGESVRKIFPSFAIAENIPFRSLRCGWNGPITLIRKEVLPRSAVSIPGDVDVKAVVFWETKRFATQVPFSNMNRAVVGSSKCFGQRPLLDGEATTLSALVQSGLGIPTA